MVAVLSPASVEREAVTFQLARITAYLQETLGQKVVAYLAGLKDPKMVGAWARGRVMPRGAASMRLRYAYQAARILAETYDAETARAWFFGTNHLLDDDAPAYVLRYAETPEDVRSIVPAAWSFAGSAA